MGGSLKCDFITPPPHPTPPIVYPYLTPYPFRGHNKPCLTIGLDGNGFVLYPVLLWSINESCLTMGLGDFVLGYGASINNILPIMS